MTTFNKNGVPVVFTRSDSAGGSVRGSNLSIKEEQKFFKKGRFAVVEINGQIIIKEGVCATAVIARAMNGDYPHILHWPELNEHGRIIVRKNGHDPNLVAVISDSEGNLHLKRGEDAEVIFAGKLPAGCELEFIPPKKAKELKVSIN